jgi:tartrate dehydratase beta subunit/fumarate hydratase class I family protein
MKFRGHIYVKRDAALNRIQNSWPSINHLMVYIVQHCCILCISKKENELLGEQ